MTKTTSNKINDIIKKMKYSAYCCLVLVLLVSIPSVMFNSYQALYTITPLVFAAIPIILTLGLAEVQITQTEKAEDMRRIERSLEMFYRPLQKLFDGHENNPSGYDKIKYDEIGQYRHLAEPNTLSCFETCPQTNETLKELLKYVREDIHTLQNNYKNLKD